MRVCALSFCHHILLQHGAVPSARQPISCPNWLFLAVAFASAWQGGETQALARMEDYLKDAKWVCGFEKPQTDPSAFERPATTVLSPYLKFGCLSPRLFHSRLVLMYRAAKGAHSKPPVSLRGQLLWREFFYTVRGNHSAQPWALVGPNESDGMCCINKVVVLYCAAGSAAYTCWTSALCVTQSLLTASLSPNV
jgi:hypothetical protein